MPEDRDDRSILDADPLWRRVIQLWVVADGSGGSRVSSAAFDNSSDGSGTSVTLGREAQEAGVTPRKALERYPDCRLASVSAGHCRRSGQAIVRDPTEEDRHHALVEGPKTKSVRRELARAAVWIDT